MFKQACPFCGQDLEVPDELDGKASNCPGCGQEICFSRADAARQDREPELHSALAPLSVAAAIASRSDTMPRVTFSWAFDFVLKITVAAALIDGFLGGMIWLFLFIYRSMTAPVHHYY